MIGFGVLTVAHPDQGALQQGDHRRQNPLPWQAGQIQITPYAPPDGGQCLCERNQVGKFYVVPVLTKIVVVTILFAATGIPAGGLEVTVGK